MGLARTILDRPRGPRGFSPEEARQRLPRGLEVPVDPEPVVSVIIPVHGKFEVTWTCLDALARTASGVAQEVIVVDDRSIDETGEMLARVRGIRVHTNPENLGFIGACNAGARLARGRFLCFLNNDTVVSAGWLEALTRTFAKHPGVGVVGGLLLFPNGQIQEAGGIVHRDGRSSHYGRRRFPGRPEHGFVRSVDYVSGACLAIERTLFERLGGFDDRYAPAYYEDTDLAFRVRAAGYDVLYQPGCRIVHFEGRTHGRDVSRGGKRHQLRNRERFAERWQAELTARHPAPGRKTRALADRRVGPRLLVLEPEEPGRALRLAVAARSAGYRVSRWAPASDGAAWAELGIESLSPPFFPSIHAVLRERRLDAVLLSAPEHVGRAAQIRRFRPDLPLIVDVRPDRPVDGEIARLADLVLVDDPGAIPEVETVLKHPPIFVASAPPGLPEHAAGEPDLVELFERLRAALGRLRS